MKEMNYWTETAKKMITPEGDVYRYIGGGKIDKFEKYDVADLSFPNGYNKGPRVFKGYCPCITVTTIRCLCVKV